MEITEKNFGLVIAFWLPGFLLIWGLSYTSDQVASLLTDWREAKEVTIGGFLYVTAASLAAGMLISAVRWFLVDQLFHLCGIKPISKEKFIGLGTKDRRDAFLEIVQNHYRYYQYYSNSMVSIIISFVVYLSYGHHADSLWPYFVAGAIVVMLFFASRDCYKKYVERGTQALSSGRGAE